MTPVLPAEPPLAACSARGEALPTAARSATKASAASSASKAQCLLFMSRLPLFLVGAHPPSRDSVARISAISKPISGGVARCIEKPGLGVELNEEKVEKYRVH